MRKRFSILLFAVVSAIVFLACESREEERVPNMAPIPKYPSLRIGDFIKDIDVTYGEIFRNDTIDTWYIVDDDTNHYYLYLKEYKYYEAANALFSDGDKVKFQGKLYGLDEYYYEGNKNYLEKLTDGDMYILVEPDYTIQLVE